MYRSDYTTLYRKWQLQEYYLSITKYLHNKEVRGKMDKMAELRELSKPLMDYLKKNYNPHAKVEISNSSIKIVEDVVCIQNVDKGIPPQIINGNTWIYGVCPKCGGNRYAPAEGLFVEPNFHKEPIYRCPDCGYQHYQ